MASMLESEAKTKWCPEVRMYSSHGAAYNRNKEVSAPIGTKCIGSACMAWRTIPSLTVDRPQGYAGTGTQSISHDYGYCGKFGRP